MGKESSQRLSDQIPDKFIRRTRAVEWAAGIGGPAVSGVGGVIFYHGYLSGRPVEMGVGAGVVLAESLRSTMGVVAADKFRETLRTVRTALRKRGQ